MGSRACRCLKLVPITSKYCKYLAWRLKGALEVVLNRLSYSWRYRPWKL
jgi:hypothetical protein